MNYRIVQLERFGDYWQVGGTFGDIRSAITAQVGENFALTRGEGKPPWKLQCSTPDDDWRPVGHEEVTEAYRAGQVPEIEEIGAYLAERHGWTPEMIEEKLG